MPLLLICPDYNRNILLILFSWNYRCCFTFCYVMKTMTTEQKLKDPCYIWNWLLYLLIIKNIFVLKFVFAYYNSYTLSILYIIVMYIICHVHYLSWTLFILYIICPIYTLHRARPTHYKYYTHLKSYTFYSYTLFTLNIICPLHYDSCTLFVLYIISPIHNISCTMYINCLKCAICSTTFVLLLIVAKNDVMGKMTVISTPTLKMGIFQHRN